MNKARIVIVSPALADANNGNWQTAHRWQKMLSSRHSARLVGEWPDAAAKADDVMLALHARRSGPSIDAWAEARGPQGLAVVLTGTDLYRDIVDDATAQRSLQLAQRLVVLQDMGPQALSTAMRNKPQVIFQSPTARSPSDKTPHHLRAVMVGHLRAEKDPLTLMAAAALLQTGDGIFIDHIGAPLDASLGLAATATQQQHPHYPWLDAQPHEPTRRHIQRAHVLVHASRMEGGAHVVMEAVCSSTPVIASRIPGNVGMLGTDYAGYFEPGDAAGLAALLRQCRATQGARDGFLAHLSQQCAQRAPLFSPENERLSLLQLTEFLKAP